MELHLIKKQKLTHSHHRKLRVRTLYFNICNNRIFPSKELTDKCNMHVGTNLSFSFDEENLKSVFFCIDHEEECGCRLYQYRKDITKLVTTSSSVVNHIKQISKAKKSVTYLVAKEPIIKDGQYWYQLITNKPYHIN